MALGAAIGEFRRVFSDPCGKGEAFRARQNWYAHLWALHENSQFDDFAASAAYRVRYNLYRNIRGVYNPARRVASFYAGAVYPGGLPGAIPVTTENGALAPAIEQVWQWSNWQDGKGVMVRWGAALGDVLVVVTDDVARGKVYLEPVWPGQVSDLTLDAQGNVKGYRREFTAVDAAGREYTYAKEVDGDSIRTYKDGNPYGYDGQEAETPNPYGFVPAVWCRHQNVGGDHGEPAIAGSVQKIDELAQLMSAVHDRIMAIVRSPLVIDSDQRLPAERAKGPATSEQSSPERDRDSIPLLRVPSGSGVKMLDLDIGDVYPAMDRLIAEIEQDLPELTVYKQMREMREVTGPAAERLLGDALARLEAAQAAYDQQSVKLFQMAAAIGGWRANDGAWGRSLTAQQERFLPFGLESYVRGDLDLAIGARPLIRETLYEKVQTLVLLKTLGLSDEQALTEAGYTEEQIAAMAEQNRERADAAGAALVGAFDRGR